ncbi:DUF802 domain-containing protein [Pusillimonas sp.]|uniref:DUF802 domain-containing protein n=1 Tax=Pusillimonas sp. TaxID=3040095 RepID=UPI0029A33943|nr:DUF802 domain-containing protein [Pusillimonas sp.]MDX3895128.1 DUF802 domain-containing protein [Pusillimonas sp.]
MNRVLYFLVFAVGLAVACWVGLGYVGLNPLALAITAVIALVYIAGALELYRYQQATGTLERALAGLSEAPASLAEWVSNLDVSLRDAVRLRVEGERVGLPGPSLTPYLVGLLVLLGMLGTFLGMVATLRGTGLALENATDLQAIRASLAAPVKGLGFAFGTSVAGVATSAMLGLLSALCRRDRARVVRKLDTHAATTLRVYSQAHQREEGFKLMRQQAQALPVVADRLQALMTAMEQHSQVLTEKLVASQSELQAKNEASQSALERQGRMLSERLAEGQETFHAKTELAYSKLLASAEQVHSNLATSTEAVYARLASSVEESLKNSLAEGARATGLAIQPAVESTFANLARENAALQDSIRQSVQQQLDALSGQFEQSAARNEQAMANVAGLWTEALAEHKQVSESLVNEQRRISESLIQETQRANEAMLKTQQEAGTALIQEHRLAGETLIKEHKLAGESLVNEHRAAGESLVQEQRLVAQSLVKEQQQAGEVLIQTQRSENESFIKAQQQANDSLVRTQQEASESLVRTQQDANESLIKAQQEAGNSITKAQQLMGESFIKEQQGARESLISELRSSLEAFTQNFEQRSASMVDAVSARLGEVAAGVTEGWNAALSRQQSTGEKLAQDNQQALASAVAALEQQASSLLRTMGESNTELKTALASQDSERLAAWSEAFGALTDTLREAWQKTSDATAVRQKEICDTLARTADDIAKQSRQHSAGTIAEIERLVQAASEAPRVAAEVVTEVRDKLSDSMARDNAMLEERGRMLETLSTLLDAVNHASNEQRTAVDALLSSSSDLLDRIGTQVADKVEAEAGKLGQAATQVGDSAIEIAGLGEVFGQAVQQFSESNASLVEHLQRVEETLDKSIARSDEQLAYYVAQAREVIDLSMLSQRQIIEELQQLASSRPGSAKATA